MSSRDELREALADQIKEVHRGPAATYEDLADAVLAVLDQQGWPREAARYEQVGWLIPESECGDGVDPGNAVVSPDKYYGDERDVPLYMRVTTAGED